MKPTRRTFLMSAGTTAGLLIAAGRSPMAYAANNKIRLGLIGTGSQNRFHIENGIAGNSHTLEVSALSDCLRPNLAQGAKTVCGNDSDKIRAFQEHCYLDYREMLDKEKDAIDAVVIATPFTSHYQVVMDCLDAGKHVFCEKTMADTYERCRDIVKKVRDSGKVLQVGHQRRYNPEFIHTVRQYRKGERVGRVTAIDGTWHRNGDWRRPIPMTHDQTTGASRPYVPTPEEKINDLQKLVNWRLYDEYSMGLIGELCSHHVETVNWLLGTPPARVWATGGIDYWRDDRTTFDNVVVVFEYELGRRTPGFIVPSPRATSRPINVAGLLKPYTCRFVWTGSLQADNAQELVALKGDAGSYLIRERPDLTQPGCSFDEGTRYSYMNNETGQLMSLRTTPPAVQTGKPRYGPKYSRVDPPPVPVQTELDPAVYEKSTDVYQFEAFAKHIAEGSKPSTNEMCGLMASISVIAAHEAATKRTTIEIDPSIYTFDFETPDPFTVG